MTTFVTLSLLGAFRKCLEANWGLTLKITMFVTVSLVPINYEYREPAINICLLKM